MGQRRFGLKVQQRPVCNHLSGIVHSYIQVNTQGPTPYPVMPDGTQAVFISPDGSRIGGALTQVRDVGILQSGEYFGIRFFPGALRNFFQLDLSEITDQFADRGFLPDRHFGELHDQIYQVDDFEQRAQLCEQWLLKQFKPIGSDRFDHALSLIYQSQGKIRVTELARAVAWSTRHLNRLFSLYTGLNTKTFIQIIRLQQACRKGYDASATMQDISFDLGYFDQSHLIKDFNKRLSLSPGAFFADLMSDFYNPNQK